MLIIVVLGDTGHILAEENRVKQRKAGSSFVQVLLLILKRLRVQLKTYFLSIYI